MSQDNRIETTESDVRTPVFTQTGGATYPELDKWQQIDEDEVEMVYQMALRNELSGGTPVVREFEQTWRQKFGSKYAITVNNGTMSLYSAMFGVGLGPGDEFICPTYTWICSLSGGLMLGARPVLCESDPESLVLDPEDVRRKITDKTRAIVAVHLWGNVCDMDALLADQRGNGHPDHRGLLARARRDVQGPTRGHAGQGRVLVAAGQQDRSAPARAAWSPPTTSTSLSAPASWARSTGWAASTWRPSATRTCSPLASG